MDTDNREAIIKSEYDYTYYLIRYGIGCYSSSIKRYLHNDIVVNLGTDYDLDIWDKIVLQDDNETCDITSVHRASSSDTLVPDDEPTYTYVAPAPVVITPAAPSNNNQADVQPKTCPAGQALTLDKKKCIIIPANSHASLISKTDIWECNEGYKKQVYKCFLIENSSTTEKKILESDASPQNINIIVPDSHTQKQQDNKGTEPNKFTSKVKSVFSGIGKGFKKIGNWFK